MKDNSENDFYEKFKICASTLKFQENNKIERIDKKNMREEFIMLKLRMKQKALVATCTGVILISGVVFAANIDNIKAFFNSRNIGKGVDSAIEYGYIENTNMDYIYDNSSAHEKDKTIINDIGLNYKIDNFLMDDNNISVEFNFKVDEKIREYIDLDNTHNIYFNDLIVKDENNVILYISDENELKEYCERKGLDYSNYKDNKNVYNSGLNWYLSEHDKYLNEFKLIYNIYSSNYPKSKKLDFSFRSITISGEKDIELNGDWNLQVSVPEKMYNREVEQYKVVSCSNNDFQVYSATVSETGFEIGLIINDIEKVEFPEELKKIQLELSKKGNDNSEEWNTIIQQSPYKEMYENYNQKRMPILNGYVEDENGERFECSLSPTRKYRKGWIDNNRYEYYETYEMNKFNSTNKIKIVLNYYDEEIVLQLEK